MRSAQNYVSEIVETTKDLWGIPKKETLKYLQGKNAFTLHRPRRLHFPRSKTVVGPHLDDTWQADLVEMRDSKLVRANKNTKYLLTVIGALSKYAWVVGLKSKMDQSARHAFVYLFANMNRRPKKIQLDKGKEFYNRLVSDLFDREKIRHYSMEGGPKAAVVERCNKTLKEKMYSYLTAFNMPKYLDALPDIVGRYNSKTHSRTGLAPVDVTPELTGVVWKRLYGMGKGRKTVLKPFKFCVGDAVRNKTRDEKRKRSEEDRRKIVPGNLFADHLLCEG